MFNQSFRHGRENPRPSNCLGIFGMPINTTENDLRNIFGKYGPITSIRIILDHATGRPKGYGFIDFEDLRDATTALDDLSDMTIDGMKVRLDYAIQRRRTPPLRHQSSLHRDRSPLHRDRSPLRRDRSFTNFDFGTRTRNTPSKLPIQSALPDSFSRVDVAVDFTRLHPKPCMRLIPSAYGCLTLVSPKHCIFNERSREWIVCDPTQGVLFIIQDGFSVRRKFNNFSRPSAAVLLNDGNCLGILDNKGIWVCDVLSGEKRQIFALEECSGLTVTSHDEFITLHPSTMAIYIVQQNGEYRTFKYDPVRERNASGQPSLPSSVCYSNNRMCIVDITIGSFNLYHVNPETQDLTLITQQDWSFGGTCTLTGGFMDSGGRFLLCSSNHTIMLFDRTGVFLQRLPGIENSRVEYICANSYFQAFVLEATNETKMGRFCRIVADPSNLEIKKESLLLRDGFNPAQSLNAPIRSSTNSSAQNEIPCITIDDDDDLPMKSSPSSPKHADPKIQHENALQECKDGIRDLRVNKEI